MTPAELTETGLGELAQDMRRHGTPFAIATVIRTAGSTAARPGAKVLLDEDGRILQGWIGGGCVHSALKKATARAMAEGQPQLISLQPQDILDEQGITAGDDIDGVMFARNGCPSKGSVDIFIEAILPMPELVIFGTSPVALALASLAEKLDWSVCSSDQDIPANTRAAGGLRMIVVATQGRNDLACLKVALSQDAEFVAFVGSRRKFRALSDKLISQDITSEALAAVHAPAGLSINAVTPDEIALSIMAQLTRERRRRRQGGEIPDNE